MFTWNAVRSILGRLCCCFRLLFGGRNDLSIEERYSLIEGSDPCGTHRTAIGDWTSQELDTQLIHSNITISTKIKPYAVFYDAHSNEVVIAIRGTLSLEDCVTDAMADPVQFDSNGFVRVHEMTNNPNARWAHEGMLICALSIRDDIFQKQILSNLAYTRVADVKSPLTKAESPFRLVIVGHSLGAGIAAILAMLMRKYYPNLRCYTYGTPGSVVDRRTAHEMKEYITSVVLADDLISRMSYHSLMALKIAVLECLSKVCVSKMKVFQSVLKSIGSINLQDYLYDNADANSYSNEFKQSLLLHISNNRQNVESRSQSRLYLPGRVVHIQANSSPPLTSLCCFGRTGSIFPFTSATSNYKISLSSVDNFLEIPMSSTMAWDHFPDRYLEELRRLSLPSQELHQS